MQGQAGGGGGVVAAFLVGQGLTATKPGMEAAPQNADPPPPRPGSWADTRRRTRSRAKGHITRLPLANIMEFIARQARCWDCDPFELHDGQARL